STSSSYSRTSSGCSRKESKASSCRATSPIRGSRPSLFKPDDTSSRAGEGPKRIGAMSQLRLRHDTADELAVGTLDREWDRKGAASIIRDCTTERTSDHTAGVAKDNRHSGSVMRG